VTFVVSSSGTIEYATETSSPGAQAQRLLDKVL